MAVSLKVGTVRTPEFPVVANDYYIMIQTDAGNLPGEQVMCMMGMFSTPLALQTHKCSSDDPLLRTDWTVRDNDQVIATGSSPPGGHSIWSNAEVTRVIGYFMGQKGKKYDLEVKFTKDASVLDAVNPHLIVILRKYH